MAENNCGKNKKGFFLKISIVGFLLCLATIFATTATADIGSQTVSASGGASTFFSQFVTAGGPIVWFILLPMSVMTVYFAVDLCLRIQRKRLLPDGITNHIASIFKQAVASGIKSHIPTGDDLVSSAISDSFGQSQYAGVDQKYLRQIAAQSLQRQAMKLLQKIEWCNTIGSVAPMVGLFGTVFGMIRAFNLLGVSGGQPRPDQLAAAISIALITTFWGLLVAIPALAIAGVFRNRLEAIAGEAAIEVQNLLGRIILILRQHKNHTAGDSRTPGKYAGKTVKIKSRAEKRPLPITAIP